LSYLLSASSICCLASAVCCFLSVICCPLYHLASSVSCLLSAVCSKCDMSLVCNTITVILVQTFTRWADRFL
jgi:hypothetical protein